MSHFHWMANLRTTPNTGDIHRFLSMINAPELEKLDLWVEDVPAKRNDTVFLRGYSLPSSPHKYMRGVVSFPSLRDISLQCEGEETTACVLRKFLVPALEKVAFTNVDTAARDSTEETPPLPVFPRLESIFRDPRLLNLTHLTLSHFKISMEPGRAEAILGYMPVLTSLSLDSCSGLGRLLEGLQEKIGGIIKPRAEGGGGMGRSRRGVKVCPRLEALSFWGCQDVDCASLRAVVLFRNRSSNDFEEECVHKGEGAPNGATETVTREPQDGNDSGGHRTDESQMGRKIKPLRKMRGHRPGLSQAGATAPSTNIVSTIIAMEESFQPAHIIYLRVANCKLVDREDALSFRELGVVDVIWAGSD